MNLKRTFLMAVLAVAGMAAWGPARAATLTPGGIEVWGKLTDAGLFELTFQLEATATTQPKIHAVQFFSMPSHTPLAVVVNQHVPAHVLLNGQVMAPRALARVALAGAPVSLYLAPPPASDTTIRLEYTVELPTGEIVNLLMADGVVGSFGEFHFTVEVGQDPMMPVERECIYCGDYLCGCTACGTWRVCCPSCAFSCDGPAC